MASMDWFPIVFIVFKVVVLGVGMFFAIKWHHDKGKQEKAREAAEREAQAQAQKQEQGLEQSDQD
jgi:flagellar basal body-associated protein FliL